MTWLLWWRPPCLLQRVIVNLVADRETALQGVLWSSRGAWLTLRDASLLKPGAQPVAMDGDVIVHRAQVLFLQVLP